MNNFKAEKIKRVFKSERGSGFAIIIFCLALFVLSNILLVSILDTSLVSQEYNNLKECVDAASAGAIVNVAKKTEVILEELSKGYLINEGSGGIVSGTTNNFYRIDYHDANRYTLKVIEDSMGLEERQIYEPVIAMVFIEPSYDSSFNKSYGIKVFTNKQYSGSNKSPDPVYNSLTDGIGPITDISRIENTINSVINNDSYVDAPTDFHGVKQNGKSFSITIDRPNNATINQLGDFPYYMVIIKDFKVRTPFANDYKSFFVYSLSGSNSQRILK
jgi:hypothetical protein